MPFEKIKSNHNGIYLGAWQIIEDANLLENLLNRTDFQRFKNYKRTLEFFASRLILHQLCPEVTVCHNDRGKPFPCNSRGYISISHSYPWAFAAYSESIPVGLDVERISNKALAVSQKFLHPNEFVLNKKLPELGTSVFFSLIWSIKESVYKLLDQPGLRFSRDIQVAEINTASESFLGIVSVGNETRGFKGFFWIKDGFVFTFIPDLIHERV